MRIGIITQPLMGNYGGLLQNFALQKVLRDMGHEPITLDQKSWHLEGFDIIKFNFKFFIYNLLFGKKKLYYREFEKLREETLVYSRDFVRKNINSTKKVSKDDELLKLTQELHLDAIIVGSDQVWRPMYAPQIEQSYLSFAEGLPIKRVAYAASFGVDSWEYTKRQTKACKKLIKLFNAVSVREHSGVYLCRKYLGVNASWVLDPTMLLTADNYKDIISKGKTRRNTGSLFTYILDQSDRKSRIINMISKLLDCETFSVNPVKPLKFNIPTSIEECTFSPVEQWLQSFCDAKFIICDSFHGMVFSIIFNKEFVVIANETRGISRFTSLLKLFGLQDRLIRTNEDIKHVEKLALTKIDWSKVNMILEKNRASSLEFIKKSLN